MDGRSFTLKTGCVHLKNRITSDYENAERADIEILKPDSPTNLRTFKTPSLFYFEELNPPKLAAEISGRIEIVNNKYSNGQLILDVIYNEDCIWGMRQIERNSIDLIVTDPPYLINHKVMKKMSSKNKDSQDRYFRDTILNDDNPRLIRDYIKECYRILKPNSAAYMFCNHRKIDFFKQECEKAGFTVKNIIVWEKNLHTTGDLQAAFGYKYEFILLLNKGRKFFNGKRLSDVWKFDKVSWQKQLHQHQKPIDLIEQCILKHSNEGDIVFDGFMGSGTTAIACRNLNRHYLGFELDSGYYMKIMERLNTDEK